MINSLLQKGIKMSTEKVVLEKESPENKFSPKRIARLKWACRRGMLELDVLLLPFVEEAFDSLTYEQQETFERLLTSDDPDLYAWIMGHQQCNDPQFVAMIAMIVKRVRV